jgi:hypothetical protein
MARCAGLEQGWNNVSHLAVGRSEAVPFSLCSSTSTEDHMPTTSEVADWKGEKVVGNDEEKLGHRTTRGRCGHR